VADALVQIVPQSRVEILNQTGADERTYRVDFSKINKVLPAFKAQWTLPEGIKQIYQAYQQCGLTAQDLQAPKYFRLKWIRHLLDKQKVDTTLQWMR